MKASVTNTERSGVLAAIQCAAVSWGRPSATVSERRCQTAMSAGEKAQTTSSTAAIDRRGQLRMSQPARIATAIHMIWKYLFMSNSTALTTMTFGTMNSATIQATRNQRSGSPRAVNAGDDRQHERDAEVGQVEEGDRRRAVLEPRLAPATARTGTRRRRPGVRSRPR